MNPNQADRARIAERAAHRAQRPATTGTNPAMRNPAPAHPMAAGVVRRTRCAPLTAAQRDSEGNRSAWSASPYYFTAPAWDRTVTS